MRENTLRSTNLVASRHMEGENDSLPVNVHRSKTSLLKLPSPPHPPPQKKKKQKRSRATGDEAAIIEQAKERLRDGMRLKNAKSTLVHGSRIIFAEGSEGCQLVSAEASLNLIGWYRGSRCSPKNGEEFSLRSNKGPEKDRYIAELKNFNCFIYRLISPKKLLN